MNPAALSVCNPASTLVALDANMPRIATFGSPALVFNPLYFGAALHGGFKHRTYASGWRRAWSKG